jgi:hypothetical protein
VRLARAQALNLILGLAALGTMAAVVLTRERPTTGELEQRAQNLLPVFRRDQLTKVALDGESAGRFVLTREQGSDDWSLDGNPPEPADGAVVDRLVGGLELATPIRRADEGDPSAFGLDRPEVSLELEMGALRYRLLLGKESPTPQGSRYAAVEDASGRRAAFVISKETAALLATTRDDFRRRDLLGVGMQGIARLTLERGGERLELVAAPIGFKLGGKERASRDALEPVFAALARLEARRFLPLAEAERARGAGAEVVVRVTPRDTAEGERLVELGGACPAHAGETLALVRKPRAFAACVASEVISPLKVDAASLADPSPFLSRADEVERLSIERGDKRLTLERRGTAFLLRAPTEAQVELDAGNARIAALLRAPAKLVKAPDLAALGLAPPRGRAVVATLGHDNAPVEESVEIGNVTPEGTLYVRRTDDGAVLALDRDAARAYAVDGTLLRSRKLLDFAISSATELELSRPERQLLRRDGEFRLLSPAGFTHDAGLLTDALLALGSLSAERWVADADDGSFGLGSPRLTARVAFGGDGGTTAARLDVGRATPGGYFAALADTPGVFVIERAAADKLSQLLVDRSAFVSDVKALARCAVRSNGRVFELERRGEQLVPARGSALDPGVAAELAEVLETLRPEVALHTGPARPDEGLAAPALELELTPSSGTGEPRVIRIGAATTHDDLAVRYARVSGVDATFVIAASKLKVLFSLF